MLQIRFSNNSFMPEAAEVAALAIKRNAATLTHAYMSDIIAGRPEKVLPHHLPVSTPTACCTEDKQRASATPGRHAVQQAE